MAPPTVLCVDDEPHVLSGLRRMLGGRFALELAEGPERALEALERRGPFGVVLSDVRMPGMDGIRLLAEVRRRSPDTVRMMLTGDTDQTTATAAVNQGQIFRFLNKPCSKEELVAALEAGLEQYRLVRAEKDLLEKTLSGAVRVLSEILSLVDPAALGRASEALPSAVEIARELEPGAVWEVEVGVLLAGLGRVTVPTEIRAKELEGRVLHESELEVVARVPEVGWRLLRHVPRLENVAAGVRYQQARWDGGGGAAAPKGEDLPFLARLLKVVSDFERLRGEGRAPDAAVAELEQDARAYDPRILEALRRRHARRPEPAAAPAEPTGLPFERLRPGHVLAAPIVTSDGRRVLAEGHTITRALLEKLRNYARTAGIREPVVVVEPGAAEPGAAEPGAEGRGAAA